MASVTKRTWEYKGEEKTAWIVRYRDQNDEQRQKTFARKKEADAYARKVEDEKLEGLHIPTSQQLTVGEVCEQFMRLQEDRLNGNALTKGSYTNKKIAVDRSIVPFLGKRLIDEITAIDCEDMYSWLTKEKRLSPITAKHRLYFFKDVFDFAIKRKLARKNPLADALAELKGVQRGEIGQFRVEQVQHLLAIADTRGPYQHESAHRMTQTVVYIAALCGLRLGEIMALSVSRIRFDIDVIEVRHSMTPDNKLKGPKTKSGLRDVPMPARVRELLRAWIDEFYQPSDDQLLFRTGRRGSKRLVPILTFNSNHWKPLLQRAELAPYAWPRPAAVYTERSNLGLSKTEPRADWFHFHALRHFAASMWVGQGIPITEVASMLGHSHFDITLQTYAHPIMGGSRRLSAVQAAADAILPSIPAETASVIPFRSAQGVHMGN